MRPAMLALLLLAALSGACAPGGLLGDTATATFGPVSATAVLPTASPPSSAMRALTIWLPPDLSPDGPGEAAALLAERLQAFTTAHPGVRLQVRIKGRSGPAGLLEALAAARQAAPSVLPDLVALDSSELAAATNSGILRPWVESGTIPEAWQLAPAILDSARLGAGIAGLPFAAEADLFAASLLVYPTEPHTWTDLLTANATFLIPLGDPSARFTLGEYLAAGGTLRDAEGAPMLDRIALQEVLSFYTAARAGGLLPLTSRQHEDSSTTGEALLGNRIDAGLIAFSAFASARPDDVLPIGSWPTRDGSAACFLLAWTWALPERPSGPDPLAIDLAQWLADPEFTGPWTRALGLIPASASALQRWPADDLSKLAGMLAGRCAPLPSPEDLALFGPVLRQAAEAVLTGELTAESAASRAAQSLP